MYGIRLVVAQADVEARLVLLDEVLLGQQRLGLGRHDERVDPLDHRQQVAAHLRARVREVRRDPLLDRLRLADVDDGPLRVAEEVDARLVRQRTPLLREPLLARLRPRRRRRAPPSSSRRRALCRSRSSRPSSAVEDRGRRRGVSQRRARLSSRRSAACRATRRPQRASSANEQREQTVRRPTAASTRDVCRATEQRHRERPEQATYRDDAFWFMTRSYVRRLQPIYGESREPARRSRRRNPTTDPPATTGVDGCVAGRHATIRSLPTKPPMARAVRRKRRRAGIRQLGGEHDQDVERASSDQPDVEAGGEAGAVAGAAEQAEDAGDVGLRLGVGRHAAAGADGTRTRRCRRRARAGRCRTAAAGRASGGPARRSPVAASNGSSSPSERAVPGMNCAIPCAPAGETAYGLKPDSA